MDRKCHRGGEVTASKLMTLNYLPKTITGDRNPSFKLDLSMLVLQFYYNCYDINVTNINVLGITKITVAQTIVLVTVTTPTIAQAVRSY